MPPSGGGRALPEPDPRPAPGLFARTALAALRAYKILFSPLFAGSCRFTPSCADYTAEAIRLHGGIAGTLLGLRRLARCHPFGPWGVDPVLPAHSLQPTANRGVSVRCRLSAVGRRLSTRASAKAR